jgi:hypothetical protein
MNEGEFATGFDHQFVANYIKGVHHHEHDVCRTVSLYRR